ncbi:MAG: hypothetical protein K8R02_10090 [Anaerohalosphaeraceae bacterium]|nr:hypothetical protein [Anaerohalosphaeraceae bacterium]
METKKTQDIALVCGNHTNAHTIVRNLQVIGFDGDIFIVRNDGAPVLNAERFNPEAKEWVLSDCEAKRFPEVIAKRWGKQERKIYVCFTNECYYHSFIEWKLKHPDDNIVVHFGDLDYISTILDRYKLYRFIEERNFAAVPKTIAGTEDPFEVFGDEFVIRPKESWQSPMHREYVRIVHSKEEYDRTMGDFACRGVEAEKLCFQELLCIKNESCIAIGGWFDLENRHLYCLRKRFQHPLGVGSGDVCERINPPEGIMESAVAILTELRYGGPLELEFVFDINSNEYKVIEMNPRFWMQHGLLEVISGRALLSRYIGKEPLAVSQKQAKTKYWVNTVQCLYRALKLSFKPLGYYYRKDSWAPYSMFQAMWYAPLHVFSKIRTRKWAKLAER